MQDTHGEPSGEGKRRVVLVGIGGATCSGKTTLAKHLRNIVPHSVILHQDDFAPPQELIPVHPEHGVQDWDAPEGAIDWPRMVQALREIKRTGIIPPEHYSHDHLNKQKDVPVEDATVAQWRETFQRIEDEHKKKGEILTWVFVDGFLLYWNQEVIDSLDVRVFLRVPHDVLKQRRHERHGYHTAEGALWQDPPAYWEQIVWPAYVRAHARMLGGDVEHGRPTDAVPGLVLVEGLERSMGATVDTVCARLVQAVQEGPES
ncbi:nicotinamide riboside kinase [Phanerochaete sordida]|uniref:Nicotinamide riboside kinase n=1 Tax=Phanerochaete sordida TaxID=48140 RepID=A0A9P3LMX9_9APHY|nr:nicotinamide riboside kinase [Phanerochaete sordida]